MKALLVVLTMFCLNGMAQENPEPMNVLAISGLNMRSQPDANSRVITKVSYGKTVQVLEQTEIELKIGWIKDHWYKVRYRGREGYIFGGYLSMLSAPQQRSSESSTQLLEEYCSGHLTLTKDLIQTMEIAPDGDSLTHTLTRFSNDFELETEDIRERQTAMLIAPFSVQQAYVFLVALLKQNERSDELEQLRLVTNDDGELLRVSSSDGSIKIAAQSEGRAYVKLASWHPMN